MRLIQNSAKSITLLVCTTTVALICASLAVWQYQRSQQKITIIKKLDQLSQQGVIPWYQLASLPSDWLATGLTVSLSGEVSSQFWWLDNQVVNGRFGYDLIVAVKPKNSSRWWLVNLGWFAGSLNREQLPEVSLPQQLTLTALLKVGNFTSFNLVSNDLELRQGQRLQYITPEFAASALQQPFAPYILYAQPDSALGEFHYQVINMSPDKHKAYALQWILLALAAVVIGAVMYRKGSAHE